MSKGLEALDNLLHLDSYGEDRKEYMQELGDVIEKDLKALEIISKGFNMWVEEVKEYKGKPIYRLVLCYNLSDRFCLNISKENYDLLKEVLKQ